MDKIFLDWVISEASRIGYYGISSEPLMKEVGHVAEAQFIGKNIELSVKIVKTETLIEILYKEKAYAESKIKSKSSGELCFWISRIYYKIKLWRKNIRISERRIALSKLVGRKDSLLEEMDENVWATEEKIQHHMILAAVARQLGSGNNNHLIGSEFMDNNNGKDVSNEMKNSSNGQISESEASRYFEKLDTSGFKHGFNRVPAIDKEDIVPAVRIAVRDDQMKVAADYENSRSKIKRSKSDIRKVKAKSSKISSQLKKLRQKLRAITGTLFTAVGIVFVLGEIAISEYLILRGFQLGHENLFSKIVLVTGIGLSSFFLAHIYERLKENRDMHNNKLFRNGVRILMAVSVLLFVFFFLQLSYVRSVIFEYLVLNGDTDPYESLFREHKYLTPVAFIGMSFMWLVGGAVMLSEGMDRLRIFPWFHRKKKELKVLSRTENNMKKEFETTIKDFNMIKVQYRFYSEENQVESLIKDQTEIHYNKYISDYERGRKEREKVVKDGIVNRLMAGNNGSSKLPFERFDLTVRRMLDEKSIDNFLNNKESDHDQKYIPE